MSDNLLLSLCASSHQLPESVVTAPGADTSNPTRAVDLETIVSSPGGDSQG